MSRNHTREFWCDVVSEMVQIRLDRRYRFGHPPVYFVQCNQTDCQYVDENKPPCPLHVGMFTEEIRAAEEARGRLHEQEGDLRGTEVVPNPSGAHSGSFPAHSSAKRF